MLFALMFVVALVITLLTPVTMSLSPSLSGDEALFVGVPSQDESAMRNSGAFWKYKNTK